MSETGQKIPLGVGRILSDSFSILVGNFFKLLAIGSVLAFIALSLARSLAVYVTFQTNLLDGYGSLIVFPVFAMIFATAFSLLTAVLVQLAYDAKLSRRGSFGSYVRSAVPTILPIIVLTAIVTVLTYASTLALLIGALWVYAVCSVTVPAAVIERAGFGALGRSAALTEEYRWPIVVAYAVVAAVNALLSRLAEFLGSLSLGAITMHFWMLPTNAIMFAYGAVISLVVALGLAYGSIVSALIYARLREIKEGVDVEQLADVFD